MDATDMLCHWLFACTSSISLISALSISSRYFPSPYYIWLGRSRACDGNRISFTPEFEPNSMIPTNGLTQRQSLESNHSKDDISVISEATLSQLDHVIDITPPLSSFQYQASKVCLSKSLLFGMPDHCIRWSACPITNNRFTGNSKHLFIPSLG